MSWTAQSVQGPRSAAFDIDTPSLSDEVESEQGQQFTAAMNAVRALVDAVGRPEDEVSVSLMGHANPGHGPREGWANETITITVRAHPPGDEDAPEAKVEPEPVEPEFEPEPDSPEPTTDDAGYPPNTGAPDQPGQPGQ